MPRTAKELTHESPEPGDLSGRYTAWRDLGKQALTQDDPEEALWCLRQAIELFSDDPGTWDLLGRCFERIGETERANRCYTLASRQRLRSGHSMGRGAIRRAVQ